MSTHSAVCEPYGDIWRGRYVHSDGYPTYMGPTLWALVRRDGYESVRKVLIHDHASWSFVSLDAEEGVTACYPNMRIVPGYGRIHTDGGTDGWYGPDDDMEWTYVIADDGLWVYAFNRLVGKASWHETEHDWQAIEAAGYGT